MKVSKRTTRGFTLIEIMSVVLVIGVLLTIAAPNYVNAREKSRRKACLSNLKQIDGAVDQWLIDNSLPGTEIPARADISPDYIRSWPTCPAGGTYRFNGGGVVDKLAVIECSTHGLIDDLLN